MITTRRSAEDEGVFVHSERTHPYASTPFRIVPVFLRQGERAVNNCYLVVFYLLIYHTPDDS